jgi:hypothetical protein
MSRFARGVALLVLLTAVGCGGPATQPTSMVSSAALPVLAASAVPGIHSVTSRLSAKDLAKDALIRGFVAKIASWGYLGGRQRTFQGESHHLTLVISRALMFREAAGAQRYTAFVREHEAAFFGAGVQPRRLTGHHLSAWLFALPSCACHMANPALIGVLNAGSRVFWLEINGPAATPVLLQRLLESVRTGAAAAEAQIPQN